MCLLVAKKQVQEWLWMKEHDKVQSFEAEIKSQTWAMKFSHQQPRDAVSSLLCSIFSLLWQEYEQIGTLF